MKRLPVFVLAAFLVSGAAFADSLASFSPAQRQEAEERWREGRALYEDGKVDEARLKYAQAYAVLGRTNVLWNLAVAEFYSGQYLDALKHFRGFSKRPDAEAKDIERAAQKYIPEASMHTAHLRVEATDGAVVTVGGELLAGAAPFNEPVDIAPGEIAIMGELNGQRMRVVSKCKAAETVVISLPLPAKPPVIITERSPKARTFTVAAIGGLSLAAFGLGIGFGVDSQRRDTENRKLAADAGGFCADRSSSQCTTWQSRLDAQSSSAMISRVAYVGGAVLATSAIAAFFLWPKTRTTSERISVLVPTLGPGHAGAAFGGTF